MKKILGFFKKYWMLFVSGIMISVLFNTVFIVAYIPSESMEDTLQIGDVVFGTRLSNSYERGDVIGFHSPENPKVLLCKRIVAVGGDHIEITEGDIYINGVAVDEPYKKEEITEMGLAEYDVPEGYVFVMGDNRNHSKDSRFWEDPFIREEDIVGKFLCGIAPIKTLD